MKRWSEETEEALKDCFVSTVWEVLCDPHGEDTDSLAPCITDYINFCVENTVPTRTSQCFSNNKPFKTGNKEKLRAVQKELWRKIRESKACYRRKMEDQLNDIREVWKVLKSHLRPEKN